MRLFPNIKNSKGSALLCTEGFMRLYAHEKNAQKLRLRTALKMNITTIFHDAQNQHPPPARLAIKEHNLLNLLVLWPTITATTCTPQPEGPSDQSFLSY